MIFVEWFIIVSLAICMLSLWLGFSHGHRKGYIEGSRYVLNEWKKTIRGEGESYDE